MPEEDHPIHDQTVGQLAAKELRLVESGCADAVAAICHAIADKPEIVAAMRELMQPEDKVAGLDRLRQSSPAVASRIVTAAFGVRSVPDDYRE